VGHTLLIIAVSSTLNVFHGLAFTTMITLLIPTRHFGHIGGMIQMAPAITQIISPILASALLITIHLQGVILIDFATFIFALVLLLFAQVPNSTINTVSKSEKQMSWRQLAYGWAYIIVRPGLLRLQIFSAIANLNLGYFVVLFTPLLLNGNS